MTRDYLQNAIDAFEAGFSSKAGVKDAIDNLNRVAAKAGEAVRNELLKVARDERPEGWNDLYYNFPALHVWKAKHAVAYAAFPVEVETMNRLAELRAAIKAAPIVPPVRDETKVRVEAIRADLVAMIERRKGQYLDAVAMGERFGGLPVSVSAHWVTNEHGTTFLRYFFYLRGVLTPLLVIMAAADELARREALAA